MTDQRGILLSVLIGLSALGIFIQFIRFIIFPPDDALVLLFFLIVGALTLIGLWRMKKLAVYLLVAYGALLLSVQALAVTQSGEAVLPLAFTLLMGGLWIFAILGKWEFFN